MRMILLLSVLVLAASLVHRAAADPDCCPKRDVESNQRTAQSARSYRSLGATASELKTSFNANAGKVRVVMLVSATCGVCLRGASDVSNAIVGAHGSEVSTHVVWVPKTGADETHMAEGTRVVSDPKAIHYWDEGGRLMDQYTNVLGIAEDAWDVYMVYGPAAQWKDEAPPKPDYWMHQLGRPGRERVPAPFLDAKVFVERIQSLEKKS